ncbi:YihY/virulence factor BrkB family protein [soil metagenome]
MHADSNQAEAVATPESSPPPAPGILGAIKETYGEFAHDDVMTQAAAVAFYSGLAMAPLLTIMVWVGRSVFGIRAKDSIADAFSSVIGSQAAAPIKELLDPASAQAKSGWNAAAIVTLLILAFSATSVFGQLQSALNNIWGVKAKPKNNIMGFINQRMLSLGMLASIVFLLMVSLVISTVLQGVIGTQGKDEQTLMWAAINNTVSISLFTVTFAALFKYVPDAKISWRAVWAGGFISALLFAAGKLGLAYYLGRGSYQTSYGAAVGSFVALLVWVYYSAVIVLIGAEATEVYARRHGHAVEPADHAVRVIEETTETGKGAAPVKRASHKATQNSGAQDVAGMSP